jgi:hypothetical protein
LSRDAKLATRAWNGASWKDGFQAQGVSATTARSGEKQRRRRSGAWSAALRRRAAAIEVMMRAEVDGRDALSLDCVDATGNVRASKKEKKAFVLCCFSHPRTIIDSSSTRTQTQAEDVLISGQTNAAD